VSAAGCGSSKKPAQAPAKTPSPVASLRSCLRRHGYQVTPETADVRGTAPRRFEFLEVWNLLNPNRIALAVTISKTPTGAARAAVWTRQENAKLGKGVVHAPAVQFGRIDVLWTALPNRADRNDIYGCVRASS
jgi:hypothetical protein